MSFDQWIRMLQGLQPQANTPLRDIHDLIRTDKGFGDDDGNKLKISQLTTDGAEVPAGNQVFDIILNPNNPFNINLHPPTIFARLLNRNHRE